MCNFLSGLGLRDGTVLTDALLDSHAELFVRFAVPDTAAHAVKWELTPPAEDAQWIDVDLWQFRLDEESAPVWWEDVAPKVETAARSVARRMVVTDRTIPIVTSGCHIVGPGGVIQDLRGGRAFVLAGGTVTSNRGTVTSNSGTVTENWSGGTVTENTGTVTANWGTVTP